MPGGSGLATMWLRLAHRVAMTIAFDVIYVITLIQGYVVNAIVEEPQAITCWTCPNTTDNQACNTWDHIRRCPTNYTICQTIHRINVRTGRTSLVNKRCALPSECTVDVVGCHDTHVPGEQDVHKDCISCCNYAYCNELVPSNLSSALLYSTLTNGASSSIHHSPLLTTPPNPHTRPSVFHVIFSLATTTSQALSQTHVAVAIGASLLTLSRVFRIH